MMNKWTKERLNKTTALQFFETVIEDYQFDAKQWEDSFLTSMSRLIELNDHKISIKVEPEGLHA